VNLSRPVTAWRDRALADPRRGDRTAALLGIALGSCFLVCFLTGLLSHLIQHPPSWFEWPARPAGLYRVTQGVHVATGIAAIPLLFAKLWTVYPRLFQTPVARDVAHALERISLVPLVGGALFMLVTGVANIDLWYPWPFFFPAGHYWMAWVTIGALVVHIGAKITITRTALFQRRLHGADSLRPDNRYSLDTPPHCGGTAEPPITIGVDRRRFLTFVAASSVLLTGATIGQTVAPLRRLALLAPRRPDHGTQGFPVNKSAAEAGTVAAATDPTYRLVVELGGTELARLTVADLRALPQRQATLPISCVEGWSASRRWSGVAVRDLLAAVGVPEPTEVEVISLEAPGLYSQSVVNRDQATDGDTLLALDVEGEPLAPDHGAPLRLIGPNRPGVLQTKWVTRVVVR
jgi:DMSO/TMAO reductase YedYZ molybdopterin-dependent catalytic subunit